MQKQFALPGARARYAPDRYVDVEHIKIDLTIDVEGRRIDGVCTTTLSPILDGVKRLELDAVELDIVDVTENGKKLAFRHDGKKLDIDLGKARNTGERLVLAIRYGGMPRRGLYFIAPEPEYPDKPKQVWSQGQDEDSRHWFPCFDSPHEKSTSEVIARVPASFFALSNGTLAHAKDDRATKTRVYHWKFDVPHSCYLITLAAGEFAVIEDRWDDIDVLYYVPRGREDDARRALGRTPDMLALFSERFGVKYPYEKYAQICVADFIFGGMENTTATTLTDNCLFDARAATDYDMEALVAHELAHQWFGDLLTCRDWGQGWLNEGFATYSEYVWREHAHGRDEAALELADWADQYFGEDARRYRRAIQTNIYDEPIDVFDHHLYEKGGLVLHMLRRVLGDASFWRALGHYVRKHRTGSVETRDLARAVEEATGRNLDWFFDQWIQKAGHPELKVEYSWDDAAKLARFVVKQTQKVEGDTPLFRLPLEVRFRVGKKDVTHAVEIDDVNEVFTFPLAEEPTQAIFDPGQHVLKRAAVEKPKPLWLAELAAATEAIDRATAAAALARHTSPDVVTALARALSADPFWGVRAAAAATLGQIRTAAARDALVKAVRGTRHPKARRAVVRALAEFRNDEVAAAALESVVLGGDESYFVEAEAGLSLGKTRTARAATALRTAAERDSYLDIVRQYAYRGLAELRDDTAIPLLLAGAAYGRVSQGRRAAILALGELCAGRQDREARAVRERLEELLCDKDFRVQMAAIEGLAGLGDVKAVPALRTAADRELDGRIKRRAREVIRDLEEGRGREEAVKTLRDEVERLRQELTTFRERLARIEAPAPGPNGVHPPEARTRAKANAAAGRKTAAKTAAKTAPKTAARPAAKIAPKKQPRRPHR